MIFFGFHTIHHICIRNQINKLFLINIIQIQTFKAYFNNNKSVFFSCWYKI